MKWAICNAVGGAAWVGGLCVAKGVALPVSRGPIGDHQTLVGLGFCAMGMILLIWSNLRSPA